MYLHAVHHLLLIAYHGSSHAHIPDLVMITKFQASVGLRHPQPKVCSTYFLLSCLLLYETACCTSPHFRALEGISQRHSRLEVVSLLSFNCIL